MTNMTGGKRLMSLLLLLSLHLSGKASSFSSSLGLLQLLGFRHYCRKKGCQHDVLDLKPSRSHEDELKVSRKKILNFKRISPGKFFQIYILILNYASPFYGVMSSIIILLCHNVCICNCLVIFFRYLSFVFFLFVFNFLCG